MNKRIAATLAVCVLYGSPALAQGWTDAPAAKQLYEAAKKDAQVVVWGTASIEVDWIPGAFQKVFPGIEVKVLGDNDVATKAIAEYRAGRYDVDVFMTSYTAGRPLLERGMYAKNDWSVFGIKGDEVVFDGKAALTHNLVYAVVYNKNLVKSDDLPKTWTDLLDVRYKDKMIASSFLLPRLIGVLGIEWGEEKMLHFARDITNTTGILLTRAPPQNFLQSGERLYAVANFESQSDTWAQQGLPVAYVVPSPVVMPQFYAAVMDKAPHANAARLLAGYLVAPEGKRAAEAFNHEGDYRKGSEHPIAKQIFSSGVTVIPDRLEEMDKRDELIRKVNQIIAGQAR
jgi:iron(III) transport system substrate-binding protein